MAFRLEALGGLRLVAEDGRVEQVQRRRLALLALLAAAGERGLTRDQLVGCLWPEATQDNARHALNQLVYGVRRSLGEDALRGVDSLGLDPAVVDSDIRRFESALSAGAYRDAVAHYRGPFLHGFHLPDAPEFEPRVERERARLAAAYADALERLATEAEGRGDAPEALPWRRVLAELDPLDARRATALMRALVAAGDSSGALAHGRTYEALVRHELNAPADRAVVALANEIRAGAGRQPTIAEAPTSTTRSDAPITPTDPSADAAAGAVQTQAQAATLVAEEPAASAAASPSGPGLPERTAGGDPSNGAGARPMVGAPPRRLRRIVVYGVASLALVAAWFAAPQLVSGRAGSAARAATPEPSIAVLPLKNLSTEPGDAALADGMTEALIALLSKAGALRVIPSTSVFALRDQRMDVRQIAETLRVSHLLEGGVQKVGTRLRMQARLVDARDGSTRWSETYDREMGDVFAVQDDISRSVTRELDVRLASAGRRAPSTRRYTPSIEAYEWYLRGMDIALIRTQAGRRRGVEYFERAIAADPNFAAAYAGLSRMYMSEAGSAPGNQRDAFARAHRAALRAVALDDSLAEGYVALGWALQPQREWAAAEAALKRAIALDPSAPRAYEGLARLYVYTGQRTEQLAAARSGAEVDPFSHSAIRELAIALSMNGRCDEALERLLPLKTLTPPATVAGVIRGQCFAAKEMWPEAIAEFRWATETGGDARSGGALALLGYALARGGEEAEARRILADLITRRRYSHGAFGIAVVYAGLRDLDEAFAWLDRAIDEKSVRVQIMSPMFEELQRDPRFARVRRHPGV